MAKFNFIEHPWYRRLISGETIQQQNAIDFYKSRVPFLDALGVEHALDMRGEGPAMYIALPPFQSMLIVRPGQFDIFDSLVYNFVKSHICLTSDYHVVQFERHRLEGLG